MLYGILAVVVLVGLLVAATILVAVMLVRAQRSSQAPSVKALLAEPDAAWAGQTQPSVAGLPFEPPVLFLIDGSMSMGAMYQLAGAMVCGSIRRLGPQETIAVGVCRGEGVQFLSDGLSPGGPAGEQSVAVFLGAVIPAGSADLTMCLAQGMKLRPRSLVLFARSRVGGVTQIVEQAQQQGLTIHVVAMEASAEAADLLAQLAEATGGQCRNFTLQTLQEWLLPNRG
jgi:hypothetical protein